MTFEVGAIVEGTVTGITNFGAFITFPNGKTGLVHISEVADAYVSDIKEFLKENDKVKVKILTLDPNGKIGLSIRQAQPSAPREQRPQRPQRPRRPEGRRFEGRRESFEDKLAKFMKDADERQSDIKKKSDDKRGGGGRSRKAF